MKRLLYFALLATLAACQGPTENDSGASTDGPMTDENGGPANESQTPQETREYATTQIRILDQNTLEVLSAIVKDKVIEGAEVIFQRDGTTSQTTRTNAQGLAAIPEGFVDDNGSLIIIKKDGHSNLVTKCPCRGLSYAISPVLRNLDGVRVVLNWGEAPRDLDLHVRYGNNHVYYSHMKESNANLDVDDTDSYGPETITIEEKKYGEKYKFFIHDFTNLQTPNSQEMSQSRAKVFVYMGQSLIHSYAIPTHVAGNVWEVFDISETGEIIPINKMYRSFQGTASILDGTDIEESPFDITPVNVNSDEAKRLNRLGEEAYHAGNYEGSIQYYRQAIQYDGGYGQAYSNLGLSYYKNHNNAEALWANRKAIALADGDKANVTRANSYYNIGKIYEDNQNWGEAGRYYRMAKESNPRDAYDRAIERVSGH